MHTIVHSPRSSLGKKSSRLRNVASIPGKLAACPGPDVCYRVNCVCKGHICPRDESDSHRSHHRTRPFVLVAITFDSNPQSVCMSTAFKYFLRFVEYIYLPSIELLVAINQHHNRETEMSFYIRTFIKRYDMMTLIERSIWKVILWCCNLVVTSACTAAVIIIRCQGWRDWYHEAPWGSHEAFFISPPPGIYCLTSPGLGGRLCSDPIIASVMNRVSSEWSKIEHEAFDYWVYIAADEGCNGLCGSFKQVVIIFLC